MIRKRLMIVLGLIVLLSVSLAPACLAYADESDSAAYDFADITESWKELPDNKLNDYIGNNNDTAIYWFIMSLSEAEQQLLRSKDTMLNNTISIDKGDGTFDEMDYYDWIMKNGDQGSPMSLRSRGVVSTFTAKSGYCFYRFVDNNSGYIVRYKVTFTLDSTTNAESAYNDYTVGSVIYKTGGTNSNNTSLNKVTFEKEKKYMKQAKTIYKELSDGSDGEIIDGERVYPTAIYSIFVLKVTVPKPMYTYGEWSTENFSVDGAAQTLASGSRFNFREYNWQNTGETTFDNKVYHKQQEDVMTSCVNILSCGFTVENTGSLGLAEGVPEVDTINVVYKHPVLNIDFYVNGGDVTATSYNTAAANPVRRSVLYNKLYNETYGLPEVAALGYKKGGCKPVSGKEWKTYDGSTTWNEATLTYRAVGLLDFEDGTYFTSKLRSMYVNWEGNVYKVTLDNQGADFSGTEYTWYKYNTFETVMLEDGSTQKNYFYTTDKLAVPLEKGYKIVKPEKKGYIFKGYYTEKNGQGTQYVNTGGSFINQLWKKVGPHTLYAYWVKEPPGTGKLTIRRNLTKSDYYSSHGDATFMFRITSDENADEVYYRTISFDASDIASQSGSVAVLETECLLPYGKYSVEAMEVLRYENRLVSISSGSTVTAVKGSFELDENCEEVTAVYDGNKTNWARFSHNDMIINSLE